jgi:hypothetical protein
MVITLEKVEDGVATEERIIVYKWEKEKMPPGVHYRLRFRPQMTPERDAFAKGAPLRLPPGYEMRCRWENDMNFVLWPAMVDEAAAGAAQADKYPPPPQSEKQRREALEKMEMPELQTLCAELSINPPARADKAALSTLIARAEALRKASQRT